MAAGAGPILLDIALIVLAAKFAGELFERFRQPAVIGELLVGGLLSASLLGPYLGLPDLAGHEVYVCGSVRMVDAAVRSFLSRGLDERSCFSDAFVPTAQPV